jgi:hypothetical protein
MPPERLSQPALVADELVRFREIRVSVGRLRLERGRQHCYFFKTVW